MNLTSEEIANEVIMRCVSTKEPFILVEGSSDFAFFSCHVTLPIENIIPTYGWEKLVDAMLILQEKGLLNTIGIIDLDYRGIIATIRLPDNIFTTDSHDIETMMFNSPAFKIVLVQKVSRQKIQIYSSGYESAKNKIYNLGRRIGSLRFYSQLTGKNYSFENIDISKFIDRISLTFSDQQCISHARGIDPKNYIIPDDILEKAIIESKKIPEFKDPCRLCCGHDLMEIMAIGLKSLWGSHDSKKMSGTVIEELFRLAYSHEMFAKSNLFRQMNAWFQDQNINNPWLE